jgi:hypothetical protein
MTKQRMRIACSIPKATDTYSEYVILIAFPLKQWLRERATLPYTYAACLVLIFWASFVVTLFPNPRCFGRWICLFRQDT